MTSRRSRKPPKPPDAHKAASEARPAYGAAAIRIPAAVAALLLLHFTLAVTAVRNKCCTFDEIAHVTRGYSYFKTGDFRLGPPHPPLAHYWAALPLLGMNLRFPSLDQDAWRRSDVWTIGRQFFYQLGNPIETMLWRGRAMIALLSVGLGLIVFLWSRRLFGPRGGLISLALYALSPTMLAHGALVTTDLVSALFFTAATAALWRLADRLTVINALLAAGAVSGLFLSKGSAALLAAAGGLMILARVLLPQPLTLSIGGRTRQVHSRLARGGALAALTVALVVTTAFSLWAAYGFRWTPFRDGAATPAGYRQLALERRCDYFSAAPTPGGKTAWEFQARGLDGWKAGLCAWLHDSKLLPDAYAYGFLSMLQSARGRDAFLNGERSLHGFPSFFPWAFALKTPLPLFALLLVALLAPLSRVIGRTSAHGAGHQPARDSARASAPDASSVGAAPASLATEPSALALPLWTQLLPLLILLFVYGAASARSTLNIGHRHLLPMYPSLFILCGAAAVWMNSASRILRAAPPALVALFAAASLSAYPHYLAYFNQLGGGPARGYEHFVDSSLDWGQDLPGLADWLKRRAERGERTPVYLKYFGTGSPTRTGIRAGDILKNLSADARGEYHLRGGVYCISATHLQQVYVWDVGDSNRLKLYGANGRVQLPVAWTPRLEQAYQELRPAMREFESLPDQSPARLDFLRRWRSRDYPDAFRLYQKLRFMRLCACLRERAPDAMIGYSILVYELSDAEVDKMVNGPPAWSGAGSPRAGPGA